MIQHRRKEGFVWPDGNGTIRDRGCVCSQIVPARIGSSATVIHRVQRRTRALAAAAGFLLAGADAASAESLKRVYDLAGPGGGYDKYVQLQTGVTYTGGLWIGGTFDRVESWFEGAGLDVCIVGNGAILDLQGRGDLHRILRAAARYF